MPIKGFDSRGHSLERHRCSPVREAKDSITQEEIQESSGLKSLQVAKASDGKRKKRHVPGARRMTASTSWNAAE